MFEPDQRALTSGHVEFHRDMTTLKGLKGRVTRKRPGRALSRSQIHRILSNQCYIAIIDYSGVEYEGNHPASVDMATWHTCSASQRLTDKAANGHNATSTTCSATIH